MWISLTVKLIVAHADAIVLNMLITQVNQLRLNTVQQVRHGRMPFPWAKCNVDITTVALVRVGHIFEYSNAYLISM